MFEGGATQTFAPELREPLRALVRVAEESTGAAVACVFAVDEHHCEVVARGSGPFPSLSEGMRVPRGMGCLCHEAVELGHLLAVADATQDPRFATSRLARAGGLAYLAAPIVWPDGRIFGALCVIRDHAHPWADAERGLVESVARAIEARLALDAAAPPLPPRLGGEVALHEVGLERAIFDSTDDCIFVWDRGHRYLYLNRAAIEYQGFADRGDAIARPLHDLHFDPAVVASWKERIDEVFRTERALEVSDYADFGAGLAHSETLLSPVRGADGKVFAVSALFRDVTDRRLLEEAVAARERHFQSVFDSMPIPALLASSDHQVLQLNHEFRRTFGYSFSDIRPGLGWRDLLFREPEAYADAVNRLGDAIDRAIDNGRVATDPVELIVTCKDGSKRIVQGSLSFAEDHNLVMLADLTELREGELERARLSTVLEQSPESVLIFDVRGRIRYVNPAYERLSGYRLDEIRGLAITRLQSEANARGLYRRIQAKVLAGEVWHGRLVQRSKGGREFVFRGTVAPVRSPSGETVAFAAIMRDITEAERQEAREEERRRLEALGTLSGGIAHDFNNLLGAILGFTELLQEDLPGGDAQGHLAEIIAAVVRARDLVAQIRSFGERSGPRFRRAELGSLLREAAQHLRAMAPAGVSVEVEANELAYADVDASQLHQVIMNLGTNAIYVMRDRGGLLKIRLETASRGGERGKCHTILVSDDGPGISADERERIFEPYYSTKPKDEGSGLGLAIVHGVVERHGGRIEVDSEIGRGTTFRVFLRERPPSAHSRPSTEKAELPRGVERIAVVDDEEMLTRLMERGLGRLGYDVVSYNDPLEALASLRNGARWDLLLTDLTMPGLDGISLGRTALRECPDLPVILVTGYLDANEEGRARASGIEVFLAKPAPMQEVARAVRASLDARASTK